MCQWILPHREFPEAEGAKFQCKWYCTLDRLSVLEPDFSALNSTNAFSGECSVCRGITMAAHRAIELSVGLAVPHVYQLLSSIRVNWLVNKEGETPGSHLCHFLTVASEDPEVQASFQKLKTEHDELESDFVLMSKMEVMTKSLKKSYEVTSAVLLCLLNILGW